MRCFRLIGWLAVWAAAAGAAAWEVAPAEAEPFQSAWCRNIEGRQNVDGALFGRVTGGDPFFGVAQVGLPKAEAAWLAFEMACDAPAGGVAQFFINLESDQSGLLVEQPLANDGKFHRYTVALDQLPGWDQLTRIETFRFDPIQPGAAGDSFKIRRIWLVASPDQLPPFVREPDYSPIDYDFSQPGAGRIFLDGYAHNLDGRRIADGALQMTVAGSDPYFAIVPVNRPAAEIDRLAVEMALEGAPSKMQLFYNFGSIGGLAEQQVIADGEFHVYTFELDKFKSFTDNGGLDNFRFDPVHPGQAGDRIAIRSIRLFAENGRPQLPPGATVPPAGRGELVVDGFRQLGLGGDAAARTVLGWSYDREFLYIRFASELDNVKYVANCRDRDGQVYMDDSLEFFLKPADDHYFQLAVNPAGTLFDGRVSVENSQDGVMDSSWDSGAEVTADIQPGVWSGTLKIPFAALGLPDGPKEPWRVNVVRNSLADGKGRSGWNFYAGRNHQLDTYRILAFGDAASPRVRLESPGNLYAGGNRAVFANPDRAAVTAAVVLRDLASGAETRFSASGNDAEIAVPYTIVRPGRYQMLVSAGDGRVDWFADVLKFTSADLSGDLAAWLERLMGAPESDEREGLLITGRRLSAELAASGQLDVGVYRDFEAAAGEFVTGLALAELAAATRSNFGVADWPFALARADSMWKIFRSLAPEFPEFHGEPCAELFVEAAANEVEAVQLLLVGLDAPVSGITVNAGALSGPAGVIGFDRIGIYGVEYIDTTGMLTNYPVEFRGEYPEMLLPRDTCEVAPRRITPVWIEIAVPSGTPAGEYAGTVSVAVPGRDALQVPLRLKVWDFELPATPYLRTAMSCNQNEVLEYQAKLQGAPLSEEQRFTVLDNLAKFMLAHRMNPSYIYEWSCYSGVPTPYPMPEQFGEYARLGLNAVSIANLTPGGFSSPASELREWYRRHGGKLIDSIKANYEAARAAGVADALYLHAMDEVFAHREAAGKAEVLRDLVAEWRREAPEVQVECITYVLPELIGTVDIWCPSMSMMDNQFDQYQARRAAGEEMWLYTCLGSPAKGMEPSFVLESAAMDLRLIGWICRRYQADGYLYYEMTRWRDNYPENGVAWPSRPWRPIGDAGYNGEAALVYPGKSWDVPPVSSVRLANLRDGFEDFDLLKLLEERWEARGRSLATPEEARRVEALLGAAELVPDYRDYSADPSELRRLRREAAALIEKFAE